MNRLTSASVVWVVFGLGTPAGHAADPEKPAERAKALIDQLTEVSEQDIGYSGSDNGTAFLPLCRTEWHGGLISPRQGKYGSSNAMRELVKLGVPAVPVLLDHLSDGRKTKVELAVGFGGLHYSAQVKEDDPGSKENADALLQDYGVRVGDLCYVALGQIVNREYTAARYVPTAITLVTCVPKSKHLCAKLRKEWGGLTADRHRDSLLKDQGADDDTVVEGASVRLGYYHPEAFETFALKQLARPTFDGDAVYDFVRQTLYPAGTVKERKQLVEAFVKGHGEITREGIRLTLFFHLKIQEDEEKDPPRERRDPPLKGRECLIDVFGLPATVKSKDRPTDVPLMASDQAEFVNTLLFDRSAKLDRAVRDLLTKTEDDDTALACMRRLVGRGYDADLEAELKRRLPKAVGYRQDHFEAYQAKLGWTRLHAAVELDVPELIEAALKDKLDVNARGKDGRTALHLAAAEEKLTAVEMLLKAKADPNVKDGQGRLPVQLASHADFPEVVRRLVAAGSDIPDVFTAATVGAAERMAELLKVETKLVEARNRHGFTPLHVAAYHGHEKAVASLLAAGADTKAVEKLDGYDSDGKTPLHFAVAAGKVGVAKQLLDAGADVNAATQYTQTTPLHIAAAQGNVELVKLLLARKADRAAKTKDGRTPLDVATGEEHAEVMKLLEQGK